MRPLDIPEWLILVMVLGWIGLFLWQRRHV